MSENKIFVMDPADVLATCGIALADGDAVKDLQKGPLAGAGDNDADRANGAAPPSQDRAAGN
jgi:hypothetical protein